MKTLLIDNYDSFTYNLFQLLAEANGEEPLVVRNDEASWVELARLEFDNVVISPGPGRPDRRDDFGVCAEAIRGSTAPLLGVCLGHQGLGRLTAAQVTAAPEPVHGRLSAVLHDDSPLFAGIPREFQAVRYHSLCVEQPLPEELRGDRLDKRWGSDGGGASRIARSGASSSTRSRSAQSTVAGCSSNFRDLSGRFLRVLRGHHERGDGCPSAQRRHVFRPGGFGAAGFPGEKPSQREGHPVAPSPRLVVKRLERLADPERAFVQLYGESENAFWLDSSRVDGSARFSFMGDDSGPLGATITYDVGDGEVKIERDGEVELRRESIFEYLAAEMARLRLPEAELPFDFDCGFAGWLGYELKAECGGEAAHESSLPDAAFVFADRMIAFDHAEGRTYLLCLAEPGGEAEAEQWLTATGRKLETLPPLPALARLSDISRQTRQDGREDGAAPGALARALPRGDRGVQAAARRRGDIRDLPDQHGRG